MSGFKVSPASGGSAYPARLTWTVVLICFLGILSEGYDVGVMGAILPALAASDWHLTPVQLGAMASWALVGMFFGGALAGTMSDLYGRKRLFLACLTLFSLSMGGAAWAPTPTTFAVFRFIGGIGLGGIIPVSAALTVEYSPPADRNRNYGYMYAGYSLGILAAALLAAAILGSLGWRGVIGAGLLPLALVPVAWRVLPESLESLVAAGRTEQAAQLAARLGIQAPVVTSRPRRLGWGAALRAVFARDRLAATACFWVAIFMGLLLVYGLGTWLPQIMRRSGYQLGPALMFLAVFALSSAIGGVAIGVASDRRSVRMTLAACYFAGAVAIELMTYNGGMALTYALVAVAGFGSISASLILCAWIASYFEPESRATVLGWALSFGRFGAVAGPIVAGWVQQSGLGLAWSFHTFALAAIIACAAVLLVPAQLATRAAKPATIGAH